MFTSSRVMKPKKGHADGTRQMSLRNKHLPRPSVWVSNFSPQVCFWWVFWGPNFRPLEDSGINIYKPQTNISDEEIDESWKTRSSFIASWQIEFRSHGDVANEMRSHLKRRGDLCGFTMIWVFPKIVVPQNGW